MQLFTLIGSYHKLKYVQVIHNAFLKHEKGRTHDKAFLIRIKHVREKQKNKKYFISQRKVKWLVFCLPFTTVVFYEKWLVLMLQKIIS